eukprot:TRINITY_DN1337_c0_g1_i1.p1 TRINITY_DN1337_c0_g1~~TRINITY_DN1337_c0_g1_i1.p1  ORF type:complete len:225 (+),score=37.55 TRINITY_DN1337_c0_g1_i1:42-716(+)
METYVQLISQLKHGEASNHAKATFKKGGEVQLADSKKQSELKKALVLLSHVEHAYFDGKLLRAPGKGSEKSKNLLNIDARYHHVLEQLHPIELVTEPSGSNHSKRAKINESANLALQKYCSLRSELVGLYRELAYKGFNFIESIPKIRSLLNLTTDLKPQDSSMEAQANLHELLQVELEFLLSVHQCLWEANRLQVSASVVHMMAAKKKLARLQGKVPPELWDR